MKPSPNDARLAIGDAHVHLFNGADLPVSGFFREVLIPAHIPNWPEVVLALLDMAVSVLKAWSRTASDELRQISAALTQPPDLNSTQFADAVADRAEEVMRTRGPGLGGDPTSNLADSYAALASILAAERARRDGLAGPPLDIATADGVPRLDRATLAKVAEDGAEVLDRGRQFEPFFAGRSPAELWALIKWAWLMTQSRSSHARKYLAAMNGKTTRPALIINLLVDYDRWLADAPKPGSEHHHQVRFWTEFAKRHAGRLQVETFAGYDPLQHAVQRRANGRTSSYFADLKGWVTAAPGAAMRVAGFKLYPPMGFRVWKNEPLPQKDRAAAIVRQLWTSKSWPIDEFPGEIDAALDDFFAFASQHDVPLLAHAWPSNEAYEGAGENAHPRHWLARVEQKPPRPGESPLRVCLAHFDLKLDEDGTIRRILDLNLAGRANIYFDVAFHEEILKDGGADALLQGIEGLCAGREAAADYFLFGTDWIMLAQLPRHQRYVDAFDAAIHRSNFWKSRREKLMRDNLRRFLKLSPQ